MLSRLVRTTGHCNQLPRAFLLDRRSLRTPWKFVLRKLHTKAPRGSAIRSCDIRGLGTARGQPKESRTKCNIKEFVFFGLPFGPVCCHKIASQKGKTVLPYRKSTEALWAPLLGSQQAPVGAPGPHLGPHGAPSGSLLSPPWACFWACLPQI